MRITTALVLPSLGLSFCALAPAQIVYGTDAPSDDENFLLDLTTTVSTGPLFTGQEVYGLADDDTNMLLYMSEEGRVYSWSYGSAAIPALVISPIDPVTGNAVRCEGLAFHNGTLYGVDEFGAAGQEGIYSFDLVTGAATPELIYTNTLLDIGGLDVHPATGLFYGGSDTAAPNRGIVQLDITANIETIIAPYVGTYSDIDGTAVSPTGTIYLIQDEPLPIDVFDLATLTYTGTLPTAVAAARVFSAGTWSDVLGGSTGIGTNYCTAVANSTGSAASMSASGSGSVAANNLVLVASGLPQNAFGFFLTSRTQGFVANPGGSQGNLCLGGSIGRYVGPGQVQNSGAAGAISLAVDLTQHPTPTGFVSVQVGETWNFTAWYRDSVGGSATSNFADGYTIVFN